MCIRLSEPSEGKIALPQKKAGSSPHTLREAEFSKIDYVKIAYWTKPPWKNINIGVGQQTAAASATATTDLVTATVAAVQPGRRTAATDYGKITCEKGASFGARV